MHRSETRVSRVTTKTQCTVQTQHIEPRSRWATAAEDRARHHSYNSQSSPKLNNKTSDHVADHVHRVMITHRWLLPAG